MSWIDSYVNKKCRTLVILFAFNFQHFYSLEFEVENELILPTWLNDGSGGRLRIGCKMLRAFCKKWKRNLQTEVFEKYCSVPALLVKYFQWRWGGICVFWRYCMNVQSMREQKPSFSSSYQSPDFLNLLIGQFFSNIL